MGNKNKDDVPKSSDYNKGYVDNKRHMKDLPSYDTYHQSDEEDDDQVTPISQNTDDDDDDDDDE